MNRNPSATIYHMVPVISVILRRPVTEYWIRWQKRIARVTDTYSIGNYRIQHGCCIEKWINLKSTSTARLTLLMNLKSQRPGSDSSARKPLQLVSNVGIHWWEKNSHQKKNMIILQTICINHFVFHARVFFLKMKLWLLFLKIT